MHWEDGEQPLGVGGFWMAAATVFCPQVALRIRPLSDTELEEGAAVIAHKVGDQVRPQGHRAGAGTGRVFTGLRCSLTCALPAQLFPAIPHTRQS